MHTSTLFYFSLLSSAYARIGPNADLVIANKYISPDGFNRSAVLAGGGPNNLIFPGPVITGFKGDTFNLNVIDALTDPTMRRATSIHWHGLFQHGSSWADGTNGVSQCPISPGHAFMYTFTVPDQAGTFWYHSHLSTQYCDGLRGAMVIYDRNDPHKHMYDIDNDDTVITLADWLHVPAPSAGFNPDFVAILINGKGRYAGGPASPLSIIQVTHNKRYRFRLVSISCDPDFFFSIDGHTMIIIEVDGVNVQPLTVDSIDIFAGQRYSFILTANKPTGNYWVRAQPNSGTMTFDGGLNSAILRYTGARHADPTTAPIPASNPMLETNLHPLSSPAAPGAAHAGGADVAINLNVAFNYTSMTYSMNGATFAPPSVPVLLQILSGAQSAQELLPSGSVYSLPANKVIEITMPGGSDDSPHPFHLHGQTFSVVRSAGSSVYNYANPVRRDVVNTGLAGDNVTIRFRTDNPGPWILHCHIDWHFDMGLAVVFTEDVPIISSSHHPSSWNQLCPTYDALNNHGL